MSVCCVISYHIQISTSFLFPKVEFIFLFAEKLNNMAECLDQLARILQYLPAGANLSTRSTSSLYIPQPQQPLTMLRSLIGPCKRMCGSLFKAAHTQRPSAVPSFLTSATVPSAIHGHGLSTIRPVTILPNILASRSLLAPTSPEINSTRTLTKYSLQKGKRKTVHAVLMRFYRLDWGIWIRTKCGRHKKIYKKSWRRRKRLRQHVFTNATQSWLLDTMVTKYWRKPKYIPDDPYNPYHKREGFHLTRRTPRIPIAS